MLCMKSFVFKKFAKAQRMNDNHFKITFTELQKIFVFSLCNAGRNNLRANLVHVDKVMDNLTDVFTVLDFT